MRPEPPAGPGARGRRAFRYPCTGHTSVDGFPAFLAAHLGPSRANLHALARELGQAFGAERITLTNSGSSANLAAALALAERCGSRLHAVVAGFTFPTTLSALRAAGFTVTVADTEPDGFGLDPQAAARALRPDTGLLAVTHFLGFPARIPELVQLASRHGLLVLQDACETMELQAGGVPAHRLGTLSTWSFYHPHHLSAFGGGAVLAQDEAWQRTLESFVHWGRACTCHAQGLPCEAPAGADHNFWYVRPGHNLEMSELNACFGRFQLRTWRDQEARRKGSYHVLHESLEGLPGIRVWPAPAGSGSPFVFPIAVAPQRRAELAERLLRRGVEVRSLMGGAITDQPAFRAIPDDGLRNARRLAGSAFFVGVHQTLPEEDVSAVAALLREELLR